MHFSTNWIIGPKTAKEDTVDISDSLPQACIDPACVPFRRPSPLWSCSIASAKHDSIYLTNRIIIIHGVLESLVH